MATETSGWHWDGRAGVGTPGTGTSVYLQNGEGVGGGGEAEPRAPSPAAAGQGWCPLLLGLDEGVVDGLDDDVQVQGVVDEVLGGALLQVGVGEEIGRLVRALVEAVGVLDQHAALLPHAHQHRFLEADAGKIGAAHGRGDDEARAAVLDARRLDGARHRVRVDGAQADGQPARREERVPGQPLAGVVAAGPQLGLETGAAVVPRRVVDDPLGAPAGREVVAGQEHAAVDVEILGEVQGGGGVELEGLEQEVPHGAVVPRQHRRLRLQPEQLAGGDHGVADGAQHPLGHRLLGLPPAQPALHGGVELQLAVQHQVGALQQQQQQLHADRSPLGAAQHGRKVPSQELEAALLQRRVPDAHGVVVPAHHVALARLAGQVAPHVVGHAALQPPHPVFAGQLVHGDGLVQQDGDPPAVQGPWTPHSAPTPRCRMGAAGVLPAAACVLLALLPPGHAQSTPPAGCGKDLSSLYYNLCDLSAAWGIAVEAVASLGVVTSFVLTIVLVASLPFVQDPPKKSLVATQVFFMLGTFGLFCLTFDFIVGPNFSTCASRRFLFGVLFGLCFSCLLAHAVALNFLARRNRGPRGWVTLAVALLLALVEVIINAEWLTITVARREGGPADPCVLADADFVLALTYVMVLLVAAFGTAWPALCGRYTRWRKHGAFILATTGLSMAIWVAWTAMYLYGNQRAGEKPGWDDPTLAIALVANACAFILLYVIPEVTHVTRRGPEQAYEDDGYPTRGVGYETILKEQKSQSMFVENKAFSMDEPSFAKKPVSPYSGYNGQLLTSVYQPTEMALMHKSEGPYDMILPRATATSTAAGSASSTLRAEDAFAVQARHAAAQRSGQVQSPYSRNRW
uniref:G protein-coupled receptor class C group 5 member C n=2 Tax=Anas platyrhynchos TaxID=8839 RepID=A0A493T6H5_ANAPP